jgi:Tol biopolymer transport system component
MRVRSAASRRLVLSIAISAFALAAISAPAWATFPGQNGRIAFASDEAGGLDIWTINPDGSGAVNVTADPSIPGFDLEPDWSPNGTKIAFRSGPVATAEIYTMNADGTGLAQLTSNAFKDYTPAWSPDGSMIAFASNRNDPDPATCVGLFGGCIIDIFVMPATGGSPVQVTFGSGTKHFPQFSPDGGSIAYTSDAGGTFAVYTVDLDTLAATKLTPDSLHAGSPDYSPDGTKIAFESNFRACNTGTSDCRTDIFTMNADGTSITRLTPKFGNNTDATWSPEGDKIAFTHSLGAGFKHQQVYLMNPDGTGITRITQTNDESFGSDWGSG